MWYVFMLCIGIVSGKPMDHKLTAPIRLGAPHTGVFTIPNLKP